MALGPYTNSTRLDGDQVSKKFEKELKEKLPARKSAALVPIRRGGALSGQRYLITSGKCNSVRNGMEPDRLIPLWLDERIIEYDVDYVVVDHQSQFQRIQIFHTLNYGNVLVLDENQSIIIFSSSHIHVILNHDSHLNY